MKILCPKCNGQGCVSKPPFVAGDINHWASSETSFTCNLCNGAMVIDDGSDEKDRVIAEQKLALNEAEKKIKQLDTKPY